MSYELLLKLVGNHIRSTAENEKLYVDELSKRVEKMDQSYKPKAVDVLQTLISRQERGW
ncbi:hypothetical protein [Exiguobacterium sp. s78]|uniref:hypothetical protein n=1 Tax=Exiguobacterium sp. s78 TaxID=2751197 RepID=UPI001BE81DBF|nr:hypothetical protein [Exiguobacterium sp. s78]